MHYDDAHDFGPLRAYLARKPEQERLPWQYMGETTDGLYHYRERETDQRLTLRHDGARLIADLATGL